MASSCWVVFKIASINGLYHLQHYWSLPAVVQDFAVFFALFVQCRRTGQVCTGSTLRVRGSGCLRTPPFLNTVSLLGQLNTSGSWGSQSPREPDGNPGPSGRALSAWGRDLVCSHPSRLMFSFPQHVALHEDHRKTDFEHSGSAGYPKVVACVLHMS